MNENNLKLKTENSKLVLGLIASPRKLGNCEVIVKEISNNIEIKQALKLIRLPSLNILPCNACYGCIMGNPCPSHDDMDLLLEKIVEADALIIASPVYYLAAHSIIKRILDRAFLFYSVLTKTYGKPCILINIYGIEGWTGVASHTLMTFASFLGLDVKANVNLKAALPGEILMGDSGRQKAKELAELLFSGESMKNESGCPFCGCEVIRMQGRVFVCALCRGTFTIDGRGERQKVQDGGILGSLEHMLEHKAWLRGMKDRFLQNKKQIVRTIAAYKDKGEWIKD